MPDKKSISLVVNGTPYELLTGKDVLPSDTLAQTLRDTLGYLGTKIACDHGSCGACTVILNGQAVLSCTTLTVECDGMSVTTIEGLEDPKTGQLHPLQQEFIDHTAFQCGFCTPGIIMTTKALLDKNRNPTEDEIKQALAGNYCRCISHYEVLEAVTAAVKGEKHG
ncbi:MAG TPA: (2Fe-2S)-binding protein [Desulfatiglandales bacterium]|nr:(2Fe-2S)-binding protein [Desulfatiglandales bacterium]